MRSDLKLVEGNIQNKNILSFAHDRIREALSISISEKEKKRLHLHLAKILEDIHSDDEDYLFEIANHYIESTDSMKILEYAFPAGLKSKEKYANDTALHYLSITTSILEDQNVLSIEHYKKMWLASKEAIGEIYLIIGKYDEAIMLFSEIIQYEKSGIKKSLLNKQICTAYFKKGDWQNTELYGRKGLKMLNEHLPTTNASMYWGIINEVFKICIFTFIPKIFTSSGMKHPDRLKLIIHYYMILGWAYGLSNTHKFSYIGLRFKNLLNNGIKNTKEGAMCLGGFGMLLSVLHFFEQAKKRYRKQLAISQAINDDWGMAQSHQWMGFCCQWQGNYRTSILHFQKSLELFKNIQDLREMPFRTLAFLKIIFISPTMKIWNGQMKSITWKFRIRAINTASALHGTIKPFFIWSEEILIQRKSLPLKIIISALWKTYNTDTILPPSNWDSFSSKKTILINHWNTCCRQKS
jgi:tetratricopeptide (TPR) repeat protein